MRPELRSVSGLRVPDVGCGTSVPGRHRAAPHVASGCLLPASTPGKSRIMGRPLTHRHTNPIQARSLRHAFPPCLCPPPPPPGTLSPSISLPRHPSFGALSLRFHGLHRHPFPGRCPCPPGSGQGKPAPKLRCCLKSPHFTQLPGSGFTLPGISKHNAQFPVLPAPSWSPQTGGQPRPSQSPLSKVPDLPRAFSSKGFSSEPQRLTAWKRPLKKGFSAI